MSKFLKFIVHFVVICTILCVIALAVPPFFGVTTEIRSSFSFSETFTSKFPADNSSNASLMLCTGRTLEKLYSEQIKPAYAQGLSAAVYTQLSDVEEEVNGLITYDRKVVKLPPETMRKIINVE